MKKLLIAILFIFLCINLYAQNLDVAPYSNAYINYMLTGNTNGGHIPLPFEYYNNYDNVFKVNLPTKYDLRDEGYIMPVRNQNPYGTCWAFSTCASLESFGMKKYGLSSLSISPLNMANKNPVSWVTLNSGGNFYTSCAYLMQLLGPVYEDDDPYIDPYESSLSKYNLCGISEKTIMIDDGESGLTNSEISAIKEVLYENGAVQLCYHHDSKYFNSKTSSYNCSNKEYSNHAVTIVGWDDDYSKDNFTNKPSTNGAFLIKNSWGTYWANEGYFWISYCDKSIDECCQYQFTSINDAQYNKLISYYDTCFGCWASARYGMIRYKIEANAYIKAIQLCSNYSGLKHKVDIYVNDVFKTSKTYTFDYVGFANVLLDDSIKVLKDDVVELRVDFNVENGSNFKWPMPIECVESTYKEPYCSYYSYDGKKYYSYDDNIICGILTSAKRIPVTSVTLDKNDLTLDVGNKGTLTATVLPENASDRFVTWSSSNEDVATVSNTGEVVGVSSGEAIITATTIETDKNNQQLTATCKVTVKEVPVTSIKLDKTTLSLTVGNTDTLTATVLPEEASAVTWSSDKESVATVTDGLVTAKGKGVATITATTVGKDKSGKQLSATCKVTVSGTEIYVTSVSLDKDELSLELGENYTLQATVLPDNASFKTVTWSSDNPKVASVENGLVTALEEGESNITVTTDGKDKNGKQLTATCKVSVNPTPVTSISLNKTEITIKVGKTLNLKATVLPENATDRTVTWSSNDENIAKVNKGIVEGISAGDATITVKTNGKDKDGNQLEATCKVTVEAIPVESIVLNKTELSLELENTASVRATVSPSDATDRTVSWTSSDDNIVSVNNGDLTAKSLGEAIITATTNGKDKDGNQLVAICNVTVVEPIYVTDVIVDDIIINKGDSKLLVAKVQPDNATFKSVTWKSNNTSIASINGGQVTGKKVGTTTLTVTTNGKDINGNYISKDCNVTVLEPVTKISLDKTSITLEKGQSYTLKETVLPENASIKTVTWSSDNENVATVKDGIVTAISKGTAIITVITDAKDINNKQLSATCKVTVTEPIYVTSVTLDKSSLSLPLETTGTLKATVSPNNSYDKTVTWSSDNEKVATVKNGTITTKGVGTANIKVITNGKDKNGNELSATCKVTVTDYVCVTSVKASNISLKVGESKQLIATVLPNNANVKTYTCKSSNTSVATVLNSNVIIGKKAGVANITVTTDGIDKNGNHLTTTCKVTVTQPVINVTSVKVSPTTLSLDTGKTATLKATVYPTNATVKTVTWKSSNTKIATVTSKGLVKAIKAGTATITATSNNGKKGTCKVTVKQPVTSVKVSPTSLSLEVGKTSKLTATILPTNATVKTVTWTTSNKNIATVTSSGVVKGIKAGTVTITVSSNNGKTAICKITVKQPVTSVKVSPTSLSLEIGNTSKLTATVLPTNATVKTVTWTTSNKNIATVTSSGVVKGIKAGTVTITATSNNGKKATCKVTVKTPVVKVTSVKLSKTSLSLAKGKTATLTATVYPTNATNKTVTWKSSNTKIATVTSKGVVKGIKAGTATITVTTTDGKKTATCKVVVK